MYELNELLQDQKFFSSDRLKPFRVPDSLLAKSTMPRFNGRAALARFNKQLIEIAFAAEFNQAPRPAEHFKIVPP